MKKGIFKRIATLLFVAVLLIATGCNVIDRPMVQGTTNFTSIDLTDDLTVGDDATVTGDLTIVGSVTPPLDWSITEDVVITGTLQVGGASDLVGNVSDSGGAFTIADNTMIDGAADAVQLTVQGHSTQTSKPFVVENSAGTDQFTVSNTGDLAALGAVSLTQVNAASGSANPFDYTGTLGIMNGSDDFTAIDINITNADHTSTGNTVQAIDIAGITADAHATEYAINVGDGWDRGLNIAGGGAVIAGTVDVGGTLNYGANDLYPVGFASSGQQAVYGTSTITGTAVAAHGLTTVTFALCTLGAAQDANTASCSVTVAANVVTLFTYEDDGTTQSTEASVPVMWMVIGAP